jgi:uncharacterized protein YbjT (DUF2867 family)
MILIVGATGRLGGMVTGRLLAEGKTVRILTRSQSNYQPLAASGAQVVLGDLKQPDSLLAACLGVDTVITTATSIDRGGEDTIQTVDVAGNRNLVDAAKATGVKQFIFVSLLQADPNSYIPLFQAKGVTEDYLHASGIPYTIIAPHGYMELMVAHVVGIPAMMGQPVTIVGGGRRKHSFISMGDVAAFIVASISNPAAINQKLLLGGPQPLSFRDAVAIYEGVLGHQIQVRSVAPGEHVPGINDGIVQALAGLDTYDSPIDMTQTTRTFGVHLTPLEEVARRTVKGAVPS